MGFDPFTDPDTGIPITRKYDKSKQGADAYSISLPRRAEAFPLSDEVLAKLIETPSLEERYVNSYKKKDFEKAYESLELFDELHKFHIFELEEWDGIVEEISGYYSEDEEAAETYDSKSTTKVSKEVVQQKTTKAKQQEEDEDVEEEEEEQDDATEIDLDSMDRKALKAYIQSKELKIRVLSSMTEKELRERILLEIYPKLPFDQEEDEEVEQEDAPAPTSQRTSRRSIGKK